MRKIFGATLVVFASACVAPLLVAEEPPAGKPSKVERLAIVDKAIAYHGGEAYRGSQIALKVASKSGEFALRMYLDGDRFDHTAEELSGEPPLIKARFTNDSVERWEGDEEVELSEDAARRTRDFVNARVYFVLLPHKLNDPGVWKQDLGLETWGERRLHKVKVTFEPGSSTSAGDAYLFWFEPDTGRLVQFAYSFNTGTERAALRFRPLFNYREVGGITFFDQLNLGYAEPHITVDAITPEFVETKMEKVSRVSLSDIRVTPLR